jgi:drug/metabolite transporter (DMT)-like permease
VAAAGDRPGTASARRAAATLALLAGATGIAFAPILVRLAETGPVATAFWRVLLSLPVAWLWFWREARNRQPGHSRASFGPLILAGLFFAGDLGIWHVSIVLTSVANSTLLVNTAPVFVTLGAWLLFRQRTRPLFWLGLLLALVGAALLVRASLFAGSRQLAGDTLALVAALCYAGYQLAVYQARTRWPTSAIMAVSGGLTCLALLPYLAWSSEVLLPASASGWAVLIALAIVPQLLGQGLITYAVAHLPASFSSVGLLLQPVMAALFAWALLGEGLAAVQVLGGLVVLAGIGLARYASLPSRGKIG